MKSLICTFKSLSKTKRFWKVCLLTTCQQAGVTAVPTLAASPRWTSSDGSPAQTCSRHHRTSQNDEGNNICVENKVQLLNPMFYLVERSQVVPGLDEEGLVDPWVVHIMSRCSHEAQEHVQRAQLLRQLQNTHSEETSLGSSPWFRYILPLFSIHTKLSYINS